MDTQVPAVRTLRGATAFNEMTILAREGRLGWHLVDFGPLRLVVEASDRPWEHLRLVFASRAVLRALTASGWTVLGTWGPWTYLKRPVDAELPPER